jgi:hypothetical protein
MGNTRRRLAFIILACAFGCGGGGGDDDDGTPPTGALKARFQVVSVIEVPAEAREMMLANRSEIETAGHTLTDDGAEIRWKPIAAATWIVRFGDLVAITDGNGELSIDLPAEAPSTGSIAHPQEPETPLLELRRDQLVPADQTPAPLEITMTFSGPCGMNDDPSFPDPAICGTASARIGPADHAHMGHAEHAHGHRPGVAYSQTSDPPQAKMDGALGSYPLGNQRCCRDYDGGSWDPTTWYGVLWNYMGSTCDTLISSGCCSGELGSISASAMATIGLLTPKSCHKNHKGRYCQEVTQGDVGVQLPIGLASTYVAGAGLEVEQPVRLGETIPVTVHNNGCFGETYISKPRDQIGGELTGGANYSIDFYATLKHYTGPTTYAADQQVQYEVPKCLDEVTAGAIDQYYFSVDLYTAYVQFVLQTDGLFRFDGGQVFDPARGPEDGFWLGEPEEPTEANEFMGCPTDHVHGLHPCTGAEDPAPMGCGHGQVSPYAPGG